jgi:hypothetical protein
MTPALPDYVGEHASVQSSDDGVEGLLQVGDEIVA